jgi:hypothetical protein
MLDAMEIINRLDEKYSDTNVTVQNISDIYLGDNVRTAHQFIFGLAAADPIGGGLEHYKSRIKNALSRKSAGIEFMAWSFDDYELGDAKEILADLGKHYGAPLDVERMSRDLGIRKPEGNRFYLVVSINLIPLPIAPGT